MLLFVAVPERSTARKIWPASPPGLIAAPNNRLPPRLTVVTWSKVGVTFGFCALLERTHQNWLLNACPPPINRLPLVATSRVPHWGTLGMLIGVCHGAPPSVERLNPPKSHPPSVQSWYWKP